MKQETISKMALINAINNCEPVKEEVKFDKANDAIINNIVGSVTSYLGDEKYLVRVDELIGACKHHVYNTISYDEMEEFDEIVNHWVNECIKRINAEKTLELTK